MQKEKAAAKTTTTTTTTIATMLHTPVIKRTLATLPKTYGGRYTVSLIPGDGTGKEITSSVQKIFKSENIPVDFEEVNDLEKAVESVKRNKIGLKGIWETPLTGGSKNIALRKQLDLFAGLSLYKSIPGISVKIPNIDFALIRDNVEGEYSGLEHETVPGVRELLKIVSKSNTERLARFSYDYALKNNRKEVVAIHKANIMKKADGLFKNIIGEIGTKEYPSIANSAMIVDNASMQAVSKPHQFDIMVATNLYGNILSNIGGALIGSKSLIPGANFGTEYAVFEPGCRHPDVEIAGKNEANPTGLILSSVLMLKHLGLNEYAERINKATYKVISEGKATTKDIGGSATTTQFTEAIIDELKSL